MINLSNPKYGKIIFMISAIFWVLSGTTMFILQFHDLWETIVYQLMGWLYLTYGYLSIFHRRDNI